MDILDIYLESNLSTDQALNLWTNRQKANQQIWQGDRRAQDPEGPEACY
jgi:hypothetical protein